MATEILRPNSDAVTQLAPSSGTANYTMVDEVTPDGITTTVTSASLNWLRDLYGLPDHSGAGTINYVKLYFRCQNDGDLYCQARAQIKTHSTEYSGGQTALTSTWATYSYQWNTNPNTGSAWTWDEIDALQAGVGLVAEDDGKDTWYPYCTQVYVEVGYTAGWTGKVSGVTNPAKVMGVAAANIATVSGVA